MTEIRMPAVLFHPATKSTTVWAKKCHERMDLYTHAAGANDVHVRRTPGLIFTWGKGVQRDVVLAGEMFRKAADAGDAKARFQLGICYSSRNGVEYSPKQAIALWWKGCRRET
jgi:hypothetical protein